MRNIVNRFYLISKDDYVAISRMRETLKELSDKLEFNNDDYRFNDDVDKVDNMQRKLTEICRDITKRLAKQKAEDKKS